MEDKKKQGSLSAGNNSVVIGGNVQGSNIIVGNHNSTSNQSINIAPLFEQLYAAVDQQADLKPADKADLKAELQEVQKELEKPKPDESFLARRFRNVERMSEDIAAVALETLKNPIGGVVEIVKRVSKKISEDAKK